MRTRAAVALQAGKPLEVMEVNLEGPRAGEVLVEIKATGICHTDEFTRSGADPEGLFPAILGHEGAGVVLEVGAGVTSLKPGDHVIPLYTPECRECEYCLHPKTNLCQAIRTTQGQGLMPDGTKPGSRCSMARRPCTTWAASERSEPPPCLREIAWAKGRSDAPYRQDLLTFGSGVTTGAPAPWDQHPPRSKSAAAPIASGLGGIGLNVIQGLRMAGADHRRRRLNPTRCRWTTRFAMTDFVKPQGGRARSGALTSVTLTKGGRGLTRWMPPGKKCRSCARRWIRATRAGANRSSIGVAPAGAERSRDAALPAGHLCASWRRNRPSGGARGAHRRARIVGLVHSDGKIEIDPNDTHIPFSAPLDDINTRLRSDARWRIHPLCGDLLTPIQNRRLNDAHVSR